MTLQKKVNLLSILVPVFTYVIPIIVVVAAYVEPISKQGMAMPFFALIVAAITFLSALRSVKKNIEMREKMHRRVNNFSVIFAYKFPAIAIYAAVVWFFAIIRNIAESLYIVLGVNSIFIVTGFVLLLVKEKLEKQLDAQERRAQ